MKITDRLNGHGVSFSFEVFPPKTKAGYESVDQAVRALEKLQPDYISVTYGAGGGTSENTVRIASEIQERSGIVALPHLSCVSSRREEIVALLSEMRAKGLQNVLALRGDIPDGASDLPQDYALAAELVSEIKHQGEFCIGAACYPEGHIEAVNKDQDMIFLKEKVDHGVDFLISQMFFDNQVLYSFLYRAYRNQINVPVIAGVMPVTSPKLIERICKLSGTSLTPRFKVILDKWGHDPESMTKAGIIYATEQIIDLVANGVTGIHLYTMNKPEIAAEIMANLGSLLGRSPKEA